MQLLSSDQGCKKGEAERW